MIANEQIVGWLARIGNDLASPRENSLSGTRSNDDRWSMAYGVSRLAGRLSEVRHARSQGGGTYEQSPAGYVGLEKSGRITIVVIPAVIAVGIEVAAFSKIVIVVRRIISRVFLIFPAAAFADRRLVLTRVARIVNVCGDGRGSEKTAAH